MMSVSDGNRQRVRGVGAADLHAGQKPRNHGMYLALVGAADADHRLFDQPRGVFADVDAAPRRGEQHNAAGLAELQRRLGIFVDEHLLDRRRAWTMLGEHRGEAVMELDEPDRERILRVGPDLTVGDMAKPVAVSGNYAPARAGEARIEANQDQPSFSITSSDTS